MAVPLLANSGFVLPLDHPNQNTQNDGIVTLEDIQLPPLPCEQEEGNMFEGVSDDAERK